MRNIFHADINQDIVVREFETGYGRKCFLFFIDGMASGDAINDFIIRPLMLCEDKRMDTANVLQVCSLVESRSIPEACSEVMAGNTALFLEGSPIAVCCETKGYEKRSISPPATESIIKGSQEAFSESLRTNTTLIHKIIKSTDLVTEFVTIGDINQGQCGIMYLDNIVNKSILDEVKKRLESIGGDFIMGAGMLEQLIEDNTWSLFPSLLSTERPERAAYYLASGRILLIADGTPYAIVLPITFSLLLDSPEGAAQRWQTGTFSRLIRLVALFCTTLISATYLALILYHREMIPTTLLGSIMSARADIPFSSLFEVLVMELFFELVREAGLRVPNMLGSAIGIVGALILGQSAVEAGFVSPVTLIVVALSGLGNTALPDYELASGLRTIKLFFILMAAGFGFLGIGAAMTLIIMMLANQNSFGVPMLTMQSIKWSAGTPIPFQLPLWKQELRPKENKPQKIRQAPHISRPWFYKQKEEDQK